MHLPERSLGVAGEDAVRQQLFSLRQSLLLPPAAKIVVFGDLNWGRAGVAPSDYGDL